MTREEIENFNPDKNFVSVQDKLSEYARTKPESTAIICDDKIYSYKMLDEQSDKIAAALHKICPQITKESLVLFVLNRSFYVPAVIFGILKTGAAFIPQTPEIPAERIKYSMKDSKSPLLITSEKIRQKKPELEDTSYKIVTVEELLSLAEKENLSQYRIQVTSTNLAMCLYTSGSTGNPKGVLIEHRSVFTEGSRETFLETLMPGTLVFDDIAPITFVLFYTGFFGAVYSGLGLHLSLEGDLKDLKKFSEQMYQYKVNTILGIPSFFKLYFAYASGEQLKYVMHLGTGGEPLLFDDAKKMFEKQPQLRIVYGYGATELDSVAVYKIVSKDTEVFSNGSPFFCKAYILDEDEKELGVNQKGELVMSGPITFRSYLNLPEETSRNLISLNGKKAYKTGDLAYWTENGEIIICGRADEMVKFKGQRVELPEIEKTLLNIPGIDKAKVILKKRDRGEFLAAFVLSDKKISTGLLQKELSKTLPPYMIPQVFVQLESMPVNQNGKIDKLALKNMEIPFETEEYKKAETESESIICNAFKKVLELGERNIGSHDDFFKLGGSSLDTLELIMELEKQGLVLSASDIYRGRTVEKIAESARFRPDSQNLKEFEFECRKKTYKVTTEQKFMLEEELSKSDERSVYNLFFICDFGKKYNSEKLRAAVDKVVASHPAFSSVFSKNNEDEFFISYHPELTKKTELVNLTEEELEEFRQKPGKAFAIFEETLFRPKVFVTEKSIYLFFEIHHAIGDGYSLGLIVPQILAAYSGEKLDEDYFYSYLQSISDIENSPEYKEARHYYDSLKGNEKWCDILSYDHSKTFGTSCCPVFETGVRTAELEKAEKKFSTSRNALSIACALLALSEITGEKKVCFSWTYDNHKEAKYSDSIGCFIKNLPAFADFEKLDTKEKLIAEINEQIEKGIYYSEYLDLFFASDPDLDSYSAEIIYQKHVFDIFPYFKNSGIEPEEIELEHPAPVVLEIEMFEEDGKLFSLVEYADNLYTKEQIEKFVERFNKHLQNFVD